MAKAEWGQKRLCQGCAARFYDLARDPILCPKCGATFDPLLVTKPRRSRAAAVAAAAKAAPVAVVVKEPDAEDDEVAEVADDDVVEDDDSDEDENLIEDASELGEDDDVSEVIVGVESDKTDEA